MILRNNLSTLQGFSPSKRLFSIIGGVVEGRGDLPETGIGFVITEKPDGIFGLGADEGKNVARIEAGNENGFVDFEKMINLDGIALVNVVANPDEAILTRSKTLQSRITHNDGALIVSIELG